MISASSSARLLRSLALASALGASLLVPAFASAAEPAPVLRVEALQYTTADSIYAQPLLDTATGGGCVDMRLANEDGNWGTWIAGCRATVHKLSAGYGIKGVFIQARNAGGESNVVLQKYHRIQKLAITSLGLPAQSTTREVRIAPTFNYGDEGSLGCLSIKLVDTKTQAIENMPQGSPCNAGGRTLTLSDGYGAKTIKAQIVTAAGTTDVFTTTINYVAAGAEPQPQPADGPIVLESVTVPATSTTSEIPVVQKSSGSECYTMRLATEDGNWGGWQPCKGTTAWYSSAGPGIKGVFVQLKGTNGSLSEIKFAKYQVVKSADAPTQPGPKVDTASPTISKVTLPTTTTNRSINIAIEATDDIAVTQVRLANEDGLWGAWQAFKPTLAHTLSAGKGYKGVFVQVRDASGKESTIPYTKLTLK